MAEKEVGGSNLSDLRMLAEIMRDVPQMDENLVKEAIGPKSYAMLYGDDKVPKLSARQREEMLRGSAEASLALYEEVFGPIVDIGDGTKVDVYATRNAVNQARISGMNDLQVADMVGENVFDWLVRCKLVAKLENE